MALSPEEVERSRPFDEGSVATMETEVDAMLLLQSDGFERTVGLQMAVTASDMPNVRELVRRYEARGWTMTARRCAFSSSVDLFLSARGVPDGALDNAEAMVAETYGEEAPYGQ